MTKKEQIIHNLHRARTEHIRWVNTIKLLVSGISIDPASIQLSPTDSEFGKWFYNEALLFSVGNSRMVIEEIELLILALHDKYMKIYLIYFGKKKKSFLGNIIGMTSQVSEYEIELSNRYYEEVIAISDKLKHKLRIFESQIFSIENEKINYFPIPVQQELTPSTKTDPRVAEETNENAYFYGARGR